MLVSAYIDVAKNVEMIFPSAVLVIIHGESMWEIPTLLYEKETTIKPLVSKMMLGS